MKYTLVSILFVFFLSSTIAKEEPIPKVSKNSLYVDAGSLGLWFTGMVNYERYLAKSTVILPIRWSVKASYGGFATWGADGPLFGLSIQGLTGKRNAHLELGTGFFALFDQLGYKIGVSNANYPYTGYQPEPTRWEYTWKIPALTLGFRYQKPKGGLVFRGGIASPNGVYLGLGWAF